MVSRKFDSVWQRCFLCNIENWFLLTRLNSLWYLSAEKFKTIIFETAIHFRRHSFEKWVLTVLKFAYFTEDA